jgi:hypothetical protein
MRLSGMVPSLMLSVQLIAPSAAQAGAPTQSRHQVVGVWIVHHDPAPFPYHMYVFNADGTMQQANPDAGNATRSDSDAKGVWAKRSGHIVGKWVEITADRATHRYSGRGELSFDIVVDGDKLEGQGSFVGYDPDGKMVVGPVPAPFTGTRVTLPKPMR